MFIELSKSDYKWLSKFLNKFIELRNSHILSGMKISKNDQKDFDDMINLKPIKSGTYIVPVKESSAATLAYLLESCMCCCPGCSLASVRHRSSVLTKLYKFIENFDVSYEDEKND